jgi:hypothetical protein
MEPSRKKDMLKSALIDTFTEALNTTGRAALGSICKEIDEAATDEEAQEFFKIATANPFDTLMDFMGDLDVQYEEYKKSPEGKQVIQQIMDLVESGIDEEFELLEYNGEDEDDDNGEGTVH